MTDIQVLLQKIRAAKQTQQPQKDLYQTQDRYGNLITYNSQQQAFIDLARERKSCVLIGSAGTGKTTCMRGTLETLLSENFVPKIESPHKHLNPHSPGIVIISYTRRAVANIQKVLPPDLKANAITFHKLMEYEPMFYEVEDPETGNLRKTMKFEPKRNELNPLPANIQTLIIEESSMLSVEYWNLLMRAVNHGIQVIFLGDIYQLPPVFGAAILGYKMTQLPVIELTEVYRQALNSPIISYAHKIKNGEGFYIKEKLVEQTVDGKVTFHPWKKSLHPDSALAVTAKFFAEALKAKVWNPEEDMILIPYNKSYGTIELNKYLATMLAQQPGQDNPVYEIIAGYQKTYLRVGDKVMVDKEDAIVTRITRNNIYFGARPQQESKDLDYWGAIMAEHHIEEEESTEDDIDFLLSQMAKSSEDEETVRQASHVVTVKFIDSGLSLELKSAGELNSILLGYALTVHKAQGSEWNKVFLLLHNSHATMCSRELLYTAVTRAREELYCICEKDTFVKGVKSQRIKGTTLAEKAEYFKGKALEPGVEIL